MKKKETKKIINLKTFRFIRDTIYTFAVLVTIPFVWLKFYNIDFNPITSNITADFLLKFTLALYYFAWITGLKFDTDIQEEIYVDLPRTRNIKISIIIFGIYLTFCFALLCWANSFRKFIIILTIFLFSDIIAWIFLSICMVKIAVKESLNHYKNTQDYCSIIKLNLIKNLITGKWRIYRFLASLILIIIIFLFIYSDIFLLLTKHSILISKDLIISTCLLLYVLIIEIWVFYKRIKVKSIIDYFDELSKSYNIKPKI